MRDRQEMVVSNPDLMMGNPVIAGTRITVELILGELAAGVSSSSFGQIRSAQPGRVIQVAMKVLW